MNAPIPPVDVPLPWTLIGAIVVIAAAVAWYFVEAIEKTAEKKLRYDVEGMTAKEAKRRLWWSPMLVIVRILLGFLVGLAMGAIDWSVWYGGSVGAGAGALAAVVVSSTKGSINTAFKRLFGGQKDDKA
jgi:hypothetical protein